MSVRGDVRYIPAEISVFRSRSSLTMWSRSVRRRPIPAAAESKKPRTPPVGCELGRSGEAVVADLAEVVGCPEPRGDHAARDERDGRSEQYQADEQEDDHVSTSDLDLDDLLDDERAGDGPGGGQDEDDPCRRAWTSAGGSSAGSRAQTTMTTKMGSAVTIQRDMRPCIVSVWISRLRSKRSRTVAATRVDRPRRRLRRPPAAAGRRAPAARRRGWPCARRRR